MPNVFNQGCHILYIYTTYVISANKDNNEVAAKNEINPIETMIRLSIVL
jgi:hypothetical protein